MTAYDSGFQVEGRDDLSGMLITVLVLNYENGRVRRLLLENEQGEQFPVLVAPAYGAIQGLSVTQSYLLKSAVECQNPPANATPAAVGDVEESSSHSELKSDSDILVQAALDLDISGTFWVVDQNTSIVESNRT